MSTTQESNDFKVSTAMNEKGQDISLPLNTDSKVESRDGKKRITFRFLAVLAVLYVAVAGLRMMSPVAWKRDCWTVQRTLLHKKLPKYYTLPSGQQIPAIALGMSDIVYRWKSKPDEVGDAVKEALKAGYRHIDGAWAYHNEVEVGKAIKESGVPRDEIWLTSKLWNTFHDPYDIEPALEDTLSKLGTDYLDLYLIHWPVAFKKEGNGLSEDLTADPYPTWQKLEELVEKGKIRNIGINNFNIWRMQNLTANPLKIPPAVDQVELNYFNPQPDLLAWAKENNLLLEAYCPLGSNERVEEVLSVPEVREVACDLGMTPAQVIISWHIQRGTVVLPKSVTPSRIHHNFKVNPLPPDAFKKMEIAATSHPPERINDPSEDWGLDFDIFDDQIVAMDMQYPRMPRIVTAVNNLVSKWEPNMFATVKIAPWEKSM